MAQGYYEEVRKPLLRHMYPHVTSVPPLILLLSRQETRDENGSPRRIYINQMEEFASDVLPIYKKTNLSHSNLGSERAVSEGPVRELFSIMEFI